MKSLQLSLIGALLLPLVYAADLTGRWVATSQTPDGDKRETVIALKSDGGNLTGFMSSPQGETAISEGKVTGDDVTFVILRETPAGQRRIQYTAKVTLEGLLLKMPGPGGQPARELLAKHVSTDPPKPLPPPAPKILLPPMQDVKPNGLARTPPHGME